MRKLLPLFGLIVFGVVAILVIQARSKSINTLTTTPEAVPVGNCVPTFLDGGGPYYQENSPLRDNFAPTNHTGETLVVSGRVLARDCVTPLSHVIVDVWQANESGSYEDEWYRGRVQTNERGEYTFTTVVPKGYGEGTGYRPPHIHFKIWQNDQLLVTSQMFMPASRAQGIEEPYIMKLETKTDHNVTAHYGSHDIIVP